MELIEKIYAATEETGKWEDFLGALAGVIPFDTSTLQLFDVHRRSAEIQAQTGMDPAAIVSYQQYYAGMNPWMRDPANLPPGAVRVGEDILPFEEYRKTVFYNEYGEASHVAHSVACNLSNEENGVGFLALSRRHAIGPFTPKEVGLVELLTPHLRRAIRMRGRLAEFQTAVAIQGAVAPAYVIVDERLRVHDASAAAEAFLARGIVSLRGRSLAIAPEYRDVVASLVRGERHSATLRDAEGRPQPVRAIPLPHAASPGGGRLTVLVFGVPGPGDWTRRLSADFGLTNAEVRLTHALLESESLARAAESLGISVNTAKTQLASVFRRTGVRNQKELAQLAARLGAP